MTGMSVVRVESRLRPRRLSPTVRDCVCAPRGSYCDLCPLARPSQLPAPPCARSGSAQRPAPPPRAPTRCTWTKNTIRHPTLMLERALNGARS
eukprot:5170858-Prymnesium_polylepis.2